MYRLIDALSGAELGQSETLCGALRLARDTHARRAILILGPDGKRLPYSLEQYD